MKRIVAFIGAIVLAGVLSGCVTAREHEELETQHRNLRQELDTQKGLFREASRDHRTVERHLQRQLSDIREQLKISQGELGDLHKNYQLASDELSKTAANSLALIKDERQLSATIRTLQGTISTLRDTAKDLQTRLDEATATKAPSGTEATAPSKAPQ